MVKQVLLDLDKTEKIIVDIKRHPIGIYAWYLFAVVSIVASLAALFISIRADSMSAEPISTSFYIGMYTFLIVIFLLATIVGVHVYKQNELVVTSQNIIQVLQIGLLNKQVSQLNLAKIQDVSVDQVGLLQTFFNYGTLQIETAGEASNFSFKFTRDPNMIAKAIIEAHESFIKNNQSTLKNDGV